MRQSLLAIIDSLLMMVSATIAGAQSTPVLRVGFVTAGHAPDSAEISIERGVRLGAAEAKQTANLFGGDVLLYEEPSRGTPEIAARKLLAQRNVQILIGSSARDADAISRVAE